MKPSRIPAVLLQTWMHDYYISQFGVCFAIIVTWISVQLSQQKVEFLLVVQFLLNGLLFYKNLFRIELVLHVMLVSLGIFESIVKQSALLFLATHLHSIFYLMFYIVLRGALSFDGEKTYEKMNYAATFAFIEQFLQQQQVETLEKIQNHFQSHEKDLENEYLEKILRMVGEDELLKTTLINEESSTDTEMFLLANMLTNGFVMKPLPWINFSVTKNPFYAELVEFVTLPTESEKMQKYIVSFTTFCSISASIRTLSLNLGARYTRFLSSFVAQCSLYFNSSDKEPSCAQVSYYLVKTLSNESIACCNICSKLVQALKEEE